MIQTERGIPVWRKFAGFTRIANSDSRLKVSLSIHHRRVNTIRVERLRFREGACTSSLRFDLESTTSGILEFEPDRPVAVYFSATIAGVVPFLSTVHQLHASPEKR